MRKKIGSKFASISVSVPDGEDLAPKLKKLLRSYAGEMRRTTPRSIDLSAFMLYCSYVSRNVDELGLEDFDLSFSVDEAGDRLGNAYVATTFVDYYAGLCTQNDCLPDLRGADLRTHDLSGAISSWAAMLDDSGLSLMEGGDCETASTIGFVLTEMYASASWGQARRRIRHSALHSKPRDEACGCGEEDRARLCVWQRRLSNLSAFRGCCLDLW